MRADIWTRKLSFGNGAVLETTDEHPLYVEGSGFVKAKEVGIGSSIVTRAGPSAKVVAVEADVRRATVYNFTVADFHTYFVGESVLWVHNADVCRVYNVDSTFVEGDKAAGVLDNAGNYILNPTSAKVIDKLNAQGKFVSASNSGEYMYVVTLQGELIMGTRAGARMPHPTLVGGKDPQVLAAGIFHVSAGRIKWVDNASGHFKPQDSSLVIAADAFAQLPSTMKDKAFKVIPWSATH